MSNPERTEQEVLEDVVGALYFIHWNRTPDQVAIMGKVKVLVDSMDRLKALLSTGRKEAHHQGWLDCEDAHDIKPDVLRVGEQPSERDLEAEEQEIKAVLNRPHTHDFKCQRCNKSPEETK